MDILCKNSESHLLYLIIYNTKHCFYGTPFVDIRNKANMQYKLD